MFGPFPAMTTRLEQDLDCTDEEWAKFIKEVQALGDREIEKIKARIAQGDPEPTKQPQIDPGLLYYWHHLMGGGDDS